VRTSLDGERGGVDRGFGYHLARHDNTENFEAIRWSILWGAFQPYRRMLYRSTDPPLTVPDHQLGDHRTVAKDPGAVDYARPNHHMLADVALLVLP